MDHIQSTVLFQSDIDFCNTRSILLIKEIEKRPSSSSSQRFKRGDSKKELDEDAKENIFHVVCCGFRYKIFNIHCLRIFLAATKMAALMCIKFKGPAAVVHMVCLVILGKRENQDGMEKMANQDEME